MAVLQDGHAPVPGAKLIIIIIYRNKAAEEEQKIYENRRTTERKNTWKTPQRKIYNKPRRRLEKLIEAAEEQIKNNSIKRNWTTPKRKQKINPRRVNKDPEELREAGEEQNKRNFHETGED